MSTHAATAPAALPASTPIDALASKALISGIVGIALTIVGVFISGLPAVAMTWLVGVTYWTAITLGMLHDLGALCQR